MVILLEEIRIFSKGNLQDLQRLLPALLWHPVDAGGDDPGFLGVRGRGRLFGIIGGPSGEILRSGSEKVSHLFKIFEGDICDGTLFIFVDRLFAYVKMTGDIFKGKVVPEPQFTDPVACYIRGNHLISDRNENIIQ